MGWQNDGKAINRSPFFIILPLIILPCPLCPVLQGNFAKEPNLEALIMHMSPVDPIHGFVLETDQFSRIRKRR